jgi:hypothetical protein
MLVDVCSENPNDSLARAAEISIKTVIAVRIALRRFDLGDGILIPALICDTL